MLLQSRKARTGNWTVGLAGCQSLATLLVRVLKNRFG